MYLQVGLKIVRWYKLWYSKCRPSWFTMVMMQASSSSRKCESVLFQRGWQTTSLNQAHAVADQGSFSSRIQVTITCSSLKFSSPGRLEEEVLTSLLSICSVPCSQGWQDIISTCLPLGVPSCPEDKDAWGPLFNKTSRPRDDDETVESLWSDWDIPRRMMQAGSGGLDGGERLPSGRARTKKVGCGSWFAMNPKTSEGA